MADNVTLNAGSGGAVAATDDVAGVHFQRVKLVDGTADSTAAIPGDATNGLDVDVTRVIPGTSATHLGKAEDAAAANGDTGVALLTRRQDSLTTDVSADGDYQFLKSTAAGRVYASATVDAALPAGANTIGAVNLAQYTPASGRLPVDGSGVTQPVSDGGGSLTVDGTVGVSGTVTVDSELTTADLDTGAGTDTRAVVGLVLAASGGGLLVGSANPMPVSDNSGSLTVDAPVGTPVFVRLSDGAAAITNLATNTAQIAGTTTATGNGTASAGCQRVTVASDNTAFSVNSTDTGPAAHDAAVSGNPVRVAARARTSDYTAVANDDTADLLATLNGKLVIQPYAIPENSWNYAAASGGITNTTGVTAKAAAGAGVRNYITGVDVVNGHATVDTDVQIRDGASGTVLWRGFAKAAGGGVSRQFDPPLRGTANTLVEIANGTTGAATYFNLSGYVGP